MACWDQNLNAEFNRFDMGSGLQLPGVMNFTERTALEGKLFHKPDASCLGFITTFYPVHNLTQNTYYLSIQAAVTAANANDVIECAEYTYNERVVIDKSLILQGADEANCIVDGTGLGNGRGILINNGITGVTIQNLTVRNFAGANGNIDGGIYAIGGNNDLTIQHVTIKDNVGGSGFYANGPVDNVLLDDVTSSGHTISARGIVIWNGLKSNITIKNCEVFNNNCCGIELQDGTATGVLMENNNVYNNGDNGFGLTGMQGPGENLIKDNTVTNNGRFGIEIKNPNGSGIATGAGRIVVEGNTVSRTVAITDARDIVGIAAFRRGVLPGNVDVPTGVVVQNNTVSGYTQTSTSDGFGIVVEGTNHSVLNNNVSACDVGIQQQAGHTPYPGDGDQSNLTDFYFGRGNSPITCGITMTGNTYSSNGTDTRNVSVGGAGFVVNTNTGKTFCSIQAAIDDAATLAGHTIQVSAGTFNENVVLNKSVIVQGAGTANTIFTPLTACSGTGVSITSAGAKLKDVKITNYSNGVAVSSTGNEINNVESVSNCNTGLELGAGTGSLTILNSKLNNNTSLGFRKGTAPGISGFTMNNCEVKGNNFGCNIYANSSTGNVFDNVSITNSNISNNKQKGLYFEALSNAILENLTMDNNGTDIAYNNNCGIDINLKYASYSNISIQNCDITNSGVTGTSTDPQAPVAIAVKGRDDAPSYNTVPATLDNVLIKNNRISGPQNGIRIGEYGKTNATPTNLRIEGNDLSYAFANKAVISRINADISLDCNWHGSNDLATVLATFTEGGSGSIVMSTILDAGTDGNFAVGFQPSGNCTCPSGNLVTNTNTSETFCSIQAAIDDPQTLDGHLLTVGPGTYIENIIVSKQLTINGPNAGISPNGGTRVPEAILVPAVKAIATGEIVHIAASNVTLNGFTLDGDNTALISGYSSTNGADIDAAEGVTVYETGINNLIVQNNIFKNLSYFGVTLYDYPAGVPSSGHVITDNRFQDFGTYDSGSGVDFWGGGVLLYNNQYTRIANNVMTNVRLGVQTGNFYQANPGSSSSQVIDNNAIEARRTGVFHNLHYTAASTFTFSNNTITALNNANETRWDGIALSSLSVPSVSYNNTINGNSITRTNLTKGYEIWNVQTPVSESTISGGSVSGVDIGVFANNYEGYSSDGGDGAHATLSNLTISPKAGGTGIRLLDSPSSAIHANVQLAIGAGVVVNGGDYGLVVENASAKAISPLGNLALNGQTAKYIRLIGNANDIDATAVIFDSKSGSAMTLTELFATEDKIDHKIDLATLGFVTVKAENAFVTDIAAPTSTNNDYTRILNAVELVSNNWSINLHGTFDWTESNASASWALGNDGLVSPADNYAIYVPANLNGITFTAPEGLSSATINGPGDLPTANLEGVLAFEGGDNQNWTISNIEFSEFDMPIAMFNGAGGTDAFNGTTITNNKFNIAKDLNKTIAPADPNQNIGLHFSHGANQTISNNIFNVPADGISDGANYSTIVVMQSNTSGGAVYDGLKIKDNTINVTGIPNPTEPAVIRGIWENGANSNAAIEISGNVFTNTNAGNTADLNRQVAFWITSVSSGSKKVEYKNNEVSGFSEGVAWIGGLYTSYTPPSYLTGQFPVEIKNNKFDGTKNAVVVRKAVQVRTRVRLL